MDSFDPWYKYILFALPFFCILVFTELLIKHIRKQNQQAKEILKLNNHDEEMATWDAIDEIGGLVSGVLRSVISISLIYKINKHFKHLLTIEKIGTRKTLDSQFLIRVNKKICEISRIKIFTSISKVVPIVALRHVREGMTLP